MKLVSAIVSVLILTVTFTSHAQENVWSWGSSRDKRTEPSYSYKSGEVFTHFTNQGTVEESKAQTLSSANRLCRSGKAVRISEWHIEDRRFRFPGECIEQDGYKYCKPDFEGSMIISKATFRCR